MKVILVLILACVALTLAAPSPDRPERQEQKPVTENYNNPFNQNPVNNGWMFGKGGSWPEFGNMASKQPVFPFPTDFSAVSKMSGVETIEASAGMSCTFQNGKKKCTNLGNQAKTKY